VLVCVRVRASAWGRPVLLVARCDTVSTARCAGFETSNRRRVRCCLETARGPGSSTWLRVQRMVAAAVGKHDRAARLPPPPKHTHTLVSPPQNEWAPALVTVRQVVCQARTPCRTRSHSLHHRGGAHACCLLLTNTEFHTFHGHGATPCGGTTPPHTRADTGTHAAARGHVRARARMTHGAHQAKSVRVLFRALHPPPPQTHTHTYTRTHQMMQQRRALHDDARLVGPAGEQARMAADGCRTCPATELAVGETRSARQKCQNCARRRARGTAVHHVVCRCSTWLAQAACMGCSAQR
jgi:hypothetical protein